MSRERRKVAMKDRVHETFGNAGDELPPPDRASQVLEAIVAFALGTGFWRLVVSDSWVTSAVFGALLAAVLFSYGLFRRRMVEKATQDLGRSRRDRDRNRGRD
jgi:hypothetical protein